MQPNIILQRTVFAMVLITTAGCKEVLYSDLDENQANDMVAILAAAEIGSSRARDKNGIYTLSVEDDHIAEAIVILKAQGYPKESFQSLGDIFNADGIIGTPFEQHARFIHAMNEELSHTISSIAGVRSAKVLTTAPVPGRYERTTPPATASVTIHYEPEFDLEANLHKLKRSVSSAVPNLAYDDVNVSAFPAGGTILQMIQDKDQMAEPGAINAAGTKTMAMGVASNLPSTGNQLVRLLGFAALAAAALSLIGILYRPARKPGKTEGSE